VILGILGFLRCTPFINILAGNQEHLDNKTVYYFKLVTRIVFYTC